MNPHPCISVFIRGFASCLFVLSVLFPNSSFADDTNALIESTAPILDTNITWHVQLFGYAANFEWEEHFAGTKVVDESGPFFGIGLAFDDQLASHLLLLGRGDFFIGQVNYDGGLQNEQGDIIPYASDSSYGGFHAQMALGVPFAFRHTSPRILPFAGFAGGSWLRSLDTKLSDSDLGTHGYEESWSFLATALGLALDIPITPTHHLFAAGQVNFPIWNKIRADLSNVGGPDESIVRPKRETGFEAEGGFASAHISFSVFFLAQDFGESDVNDDGFFQPDSSARMLGARLAYTFE